MAKNIVAPHVLQALWERVEGQFKHSVALFVEAGIRPVRGEKKKEAELKVWMEVTKAAFLAGIEQGYDMGCEVTFGAIKPVAEKD